MEMPEAPLLPQSPLQRHIAQMALHLAASLEATACQAPLGQILAHCETLLLDRGRQFLQDSLAATLQQHIDDAEKKGGLPVPVLADRIAATKVLVRVSS
jgi:hypothetical protein